MVRRNMIKRTLSCLMALTMAVSGITAGTWVDNSSEKLAYAEDGLTYTVGNSTYSYKVSEDGTIEITDYEGTDTKIEIPGEIEGKSVTSIGNFAFSYCSRITEIIISNSVTSIGTRAFCNCINLKTIEVGEENEKFKSKDGILFNAEMTEILQCPEGRKESYEIPDSVISIGDFAFEHCSRLTEVTIPDSVRSIGYGAFARCEGLTEVNIPDSVTNIGEHAFEFCAGLAEVSIPDSVTTIGYRAFHGCNSLSEVSIPKSVTKIGTNPFAECINLVNIYVDEGNNIYKSVDGVLFDKEINEILEYPCGRKDEVYVIPDSVTIVGEEAFSDCINLKKVVITDGVTSIGHYAFSGCRNIEEMVIPDSVMFIGDYAFSHCSILTEVRIPDSVTDIGDRVFCYCDKLTNIEVDEDNNIYKSVDGVLFSKDLTAIIVYPKGKEEKVYDIPNTVRGLCSYAFDNCNNLMELRVPRETQMFNNEVCDCNNLTIYGFKDSYAESYAKDNNIPFVELLKSMDGVIYNNDMTELIKYPKDKKGEYTIPNTVNTIREGAFNQCIGLTGLNIPENVKSLTGNIFSGCTNLSSIKIPVSIEYIDDELFSDCENLTIYGMKGSYAETYAISNNIKFVALDEKKSDDNIVSIYFEGNQFKGEVSLNVTKLADESLSIFDKIINPDIKPEEVKFSAFDINITDKEDKDVQPDGTITVKIKCPDYYEGENCKVYHLNPNGKLADMVASYKNGYLFFNTNHFSTYLITETELVTKPDVITGDANGDDKIDIKDSAVIRRHIAGWEVDIYVTAADVNGDGEVNIKDSALIKRQIAGWN